MLTTLNSLLVLYVDRAVIPAPGELPRTHALSRLLRKHLLPQARQRFVDLCCGRLLLVAGVALAVVLVAHFLHVLRSTPPRPSAINGRSVAVGILTSHRTGIDHRVLAIRAAAALGASYLAILAMEGFRPSFENTFDSRDILQRVGYPAADKPRNVLVKWLFHLVRNHHRIDEETALLRTIIDWLVVSQDPQYRAIQSSQYQHLESAIREFGAAASRQLLIDAVDDLADCHAWLLLNNVARLLLAFACFFACGWVLTA